MNNYSTIPDAIDALRNGEMIIVVDDPTRENQGDIIFPAETITIEKANFLIKEARGMFCVPMSPKRASELEIIPMVPVLHNTEKLHCNFGVTVDSKQVTAHGISAADRALTVQKIVDQSSTAEDFLRPGHVSPIIAVEGGVLKRNGHTEASVDLAILAGFQPIGVLSEILDDTGEPTKGEELFAFAEKHKLKIITIHDLIEYRKIHSFPQQQKNIVVKKISQAKLPTKFGNFTISVYKDLHDNKEHAVLTLGDITKQPVLTRIHSKCLTGDTFSSLRCDCQAQLHKSMKMIQENGAGILIYHNQEGRGIGLGNKIKAYALQDEGLDTVEANVSLGFASDERDYKIAADILHDLGVDTIHLLTNNPNKIEALQQYGIIVTERIPVEVTPNEYNKNYLKTKKIKMHHQLTEV